jgi:hypothetical protein
MKEFSESKVKNLNQFNNWGTFEYDGYFCKYVSGKNELITDHPLKEELRKWWFMLDEYAK